MERNVISTEKAPSAIGPYSQAVKTGGFVFVSGQIPLDPVTGEILSTDVQEQTGQVIRNLEAVLTAAGSSLAQVVKTTVFIKDMNEFSKINQVYSQYFKENPPARSTVEVARLPKDVRVEIEAIAIF